MSKQFPDDFEAQWLANDENRARFDAYLTAQHPRMAAARQADMPAWPFPAQDNVAVEYLVNRAVEQFEADGDGRAAIIWGIVHAWFEASIAAESDRLQGEPHRG